jgi:hypothetical protein
MTTVAILTSIIGTVIAAYLLRIIVRSSGLNSLRSDMKSGPYICHGMVYRNGKYIAQSKISHHVFKNLS